MCNLPNKYFHTGKLKCNCVFFGDLNRIGVSICIRDHLSHVIATKINWKTPWLQVLEGEACCLLYAIKFEYLPNQDIHFD